MLLGMEVRASHNINLTANRKKLPTIRQQSMLLLAKVFDVFLAFVKEAQFPQRLSTFLLGKCPESTWFNAQY